MKTAKDTTWIIDGVTGALTVEGLSSKELRQVAGDILPSGKSINCARPLERRTLAGEDKLRVQTGASLYVFRVYHHSVIEGMGRRSVIQTSGCNILCPQCHSAETHSLTAGVLLNVEDIVELALDPQDAPRDGVTILGGEPFMQPRGLAALIEALKQRSQHVTLYTGYTIEQLREREDNNVNFALDAADIIIDGPFIVGQADGAGEWRGSRNQRVIAKILTEQD